MRKVIFLAGAMGCYGKNAEYPKKWRREAITTCNALSDAFSFLDPTWFYENGGTKYKTEREVMKFNLRNVKESDVVLVNLKDIEQSPGTMDEILYAYIFNKPIIGFLKTDGGELDELDVKARMHPWKYEQIDRIETGYYALENAIKYIIEYYGGE